MLKSLNEIFESNTIEVNNTGDRIPLHSHTSKEQGIFLQSLFDIVKPKRSLEVGFAYGISALFILEKHRDAGSNDAAHIVIEPDNYWGTAAIHNINKEGLENYLQVRKGFSDEILPQLFYENYRIQYAYIDTTKRFDVVFQDFYFINKILDVGGIVILDDCGGYWPGIQKVARFINSLPNYEFLKGHKKYTHRTQRKIAEMFTSFFLKIVPFKTKFIPGINLKTNHKLNLEYRCIAFKKNSEDFRNWDWDGLL